MELQRAELRLLLDLEDGRLAPMAIALEHPTLFEALEAVLGETDDQLAELSGQPRSSAEVVHEQASAVRPLVEAALGLVLYLCVSEPDLVDATPPRPAAGAAAPGAAPPVGLRVWEVGWRIGAQLRAAREATGATGATRAGPRPHVRSSHWHSYWTGPRSDPELRRAELRWIAPILVAAGEGAGIVPTIRRTERPTAER